MYVGHVLSDKRFLELAHRFNSNFKVTIDSVRWKYISEDTELVLSREREFLEATLGHDFILPIGELDEEAFIAANASLYRDIFPKILAKYAPESRVYVGTVGSKESPLPTELLQSSESQSLDELRQNIRMTYDSFLEKGCIHPESEKPDF